MDMLDEIDGFIYFIHIQEQNSLTTNSFLTLYITGCSIMYNPIDNNETCIPGYAVYYNLYPNIIEHYKSVIQIETLLLNVKMKQDHWM